MIELVIILYVISLILSYLLTRIYYTRKWATDELDQINLFIVICPLLNTVTVIAFVLVILWHYIKPLFYIDAHKFFRLRK
jgi:hypothetical protein